MILSIHFYRNHLRRIYWKYMYSLYKKSMADNQHHYLPCKKLYFFIQALFISDNLKPEILRRANEQSTMASTPLAAAPNPHAIQSMPFAK